MLVIFQDAKIKRVVCHVLIPAFMPVIFFRIAFLPVQVLGCGNRGLLAFAVACVSGVAALCTVLMGLKMRMRNADSSWWLLSTLILIIPVIALLILA